MKTRLLFLALTLASLTVDAQEIPKLMIDKVQWCGRTWNVKYPDTLSGITVYGNPTLVGISNRTYLQTSWEKPGTIEFGWCNIPTKNFPTQKEQDSYADHLLIGVRGKGEYWTQRSFELKGDLVLRIRAGSGEFRFEVPPKEKDGEAKILKEATLGKRIAPGQFHLIKIVDSGKNITVFFQDKEVLACDCKEAVEGNTLVIGDREINGGVNLSILSEDK